jgi:hypothetical protein
MDEILIPGDTTPADDQVQAQDGEPAPPTAAMILTARRRAARCAALVTGQLAAIHRISASGWLLTRPPAATSVLAQAAASARLMHHAEVDARHILLCLLAGESRLPARLLASLGLTVAEVRGELRERLAMATAAIPVSAASAVDDDLVAVREEALGLGQLDAVLRLAAKGLLSTGAMRMEVGDLVMARLITRAQVRALLAPGDPEITPVTNPRLASLERGDGATASQPPGVRPGSGSQARAAALRVVAT